jgi:hypothetical protein
MPSTINWPVSMFVEAANGSNILIDGAVKLTKTGDSLSQVLKEGLAMAPFAFGGDLQQQLPQHPVGRQRPGLVLCEVRRRYDQPETGRPAQLRPENRPIVAATSGKITQFPPRQFTQHQECL